MKAVVLLSAGDDVATWQFQALSEAMDKGLDLVCVAHCLDARRVEPRRRRLVYEAFTRTAERRVALVRPTSIRPLLPLGVDELSFQPEWIDGGPRIPEGVAERFRGADVLVNFALSGLGTAEALPVTHGVLSYRHGERAGGGLSSYHDLERHAAVQHVAVERLTGRPEEGEVLAGAYARVVPYSYSQTTTEACVSAVPLLAKAVTELETGESHDSSAARPEYHTPSNVAVARRAAVLAYEKVGRLTYGLIRQPRWQIARLTRPMSPEEHVSLSPADIDPLAVPAGYYFAADSHAGPEGAVYCEVLNGRTGVGEIARWSAGAWNVVDLGLDGGHASYPQAVEDAGSLFLFPEVSFVSSPALYRLDRDGVTVTDRLELEGLEGLRLLDATLFRHEENWFLFAGRPGSAEIRLDLWIAPSLTGPYRLHPSSPVCLDARGARMAGGIAEIGGSLYRFGQDCSGGYGGRVSVHRIDVLTEDAYEETVTGSLALKGRGLGGPHTVSLSGDEVWIDFFRKKTTPMAGVRRLRAKVAPYARARRSS